MTYKGKHTTARGVHLNAFSSPFRYKLKGKIFVFRSKTKMNSFKRKLSYEMNRVNSAFIKIYQISNTKPTQELIDTIEMKVAVKIYRTIEEWEILDESI